MRDLRSSLTLLEAASSPVLLGDLKRHLRIETDLADDDDYLNGLLSAAQNYVEGRSGITGRAMLTQRWRLDLETFCDWRRACEAWPPTYAGEIKIPLPPLRSVEAVQYLDATSTLQTVDASTYRIVSGGGQRSSIIPKPGFAWPSPPYAPDAVQISFTCGYADRASLAAERQGMIHAILLLAAHWYENREGVVTPLGNDAKDIPFGIAALLAPHTIAAF